MKIREKEMLYMIDEPFWRILEIRYSVCPLYDSLIKKNSRNRILRNWARLDSSYPFFRGVDTNKDKKASIVPLGFIQRHERGVGITTYHQFKFWGNGSSLKLAWSGDQALRNVRGSLPSTEANGSMQY